MSAVNECYLVETGFGFVSNGERGFSRGNYIPYLTLNEFIKRRNYVSAFCSAYRYAFEDVDNSPLYGNLYLDFDDENDFEHVRKDVLTAISYFKIIYHISPENEMKIYFSGNKGVHIIIPAEVFGIQPMLQLNCVFKHIAMSIKTYSPYKTIDTKIYDARRLFRIPNTIHEKSGLYKIPITVDEIKTLSENRIREIALQPRRFPRNTEYLMNAIAHRQFEKDVQEFYMFDKESKKDKCSRKTITFIPPCIQNILDNGAQEGERNITIACLAGFYKSYGKSLNETIDAITDWNSRNIAPTGQNELNRTVRSIYNSNKLFGCSTLKLLSVCQENNCRLSKKKG